MTSPQRARWRVRVLGVFVIIACLAALLIAGEMAMRRFRPDLNPSNRLRSIPDSSIGWRFEPGQEMDGWTEHGRPRHIRTNALGFPDRNHNLEPPLDTLRIAFLGDSFTAAVGVDAEASFVAQTRRTLQGGGLDKKIETLNFGVPSFGTCNEYLAWKHYAVVFHPQIVVLAFFLGNDVVDNLLEDSSANVNAPKFQAVEGTLVPVPFRVTVNPEVEEHTHRSWVYRNILAPSILYQQYKLLERNWRGKFGFRRPRKIENLNPDTPFWKRAYAPRDWRVYLRAPGPELETAWRVTELLLRQLRDEVSESGAQFYVTLIPGLESMDPAMFRASWKRYPGIEQFEFDLDGPRQRLLAYCAQEKIEVVDLAAVFTEHLRTHPASELYFKFDLHFSEEGHRVAGEAIARRLLDASSSGK